MSDDKTLNCVDCNEDFVFTASEQDFYKEKGFDNEPKRCADCRRAKKQASQERHEITCAECGNSDTVPFQPRGDKPVLCRDCFSKQKEQEAA